MKRDYYDANRADTETWFICDRKGCTATSRAGFTIDHAWQRAKADGWYTLPVSGGTGKPGRWYHYCAEHKDQWRAKLAQEAEQEEDYLIRMHNEHVARGVA